VLVFALAGVAVLAVAALLATQLSDDSDDGGAATETETEVATVEISGQPLPQLPAGDDDPAVGTPVPELSGSVLGEGDPMRIPSEGAKILIFVAHWCPHCQREVPVITDWLEENGEPEGVDLYAVSTGVDKPRGNYPPSSWLAEEGWPVETMADDADSTAASAFGLTAFPFYVVTDDAGDVVFRTSGELTTEQLESLVAAARGTD
jgi:thiol-disulfide isomerase/thioredoxin